jgi:uncharacterized membrane protein
MNDQAKRMTGLAMACAFSTALSLVAAYDKAAGAECDQSLVPKGTCLTIELPGDRKGSLEPLDRDLPPA